MLRLAVFPTNSSLESIEVICHFHSDFPLDILEVLQSLVNKSLLNVAFDEAGEPRFGMLATVREYALEKLKSSNLITVLQNQHTTYFLNLVEEAVQHFNSSDQAIWYNRLTLEFLNLNAAIEYSLDNKSLKSALRLGASLGRFWQIRGFMNVGCYWLNSILAATAEQNIDLDLLRAKVTNMLALLYLEQGSLNASKELYDKSLPVFQTFDDGLGISACYKGLGNIAFHKGNFPLALEYYEEGLEIFRQVGNKKEIADYLSNMGVIASLNMDYNRARKYNEESLALREELGDKLRAYPKNKKGAKISQKLKSLEEPP